MKHAILTILALVGLWSVLLVGVMQSEEDLMDDCMQSHSYDTCYLIIKR